MRKPTAPNITNHFTSWYQPHNKHLSLSLSHQRMKERMEKLVVLPFSMGCVSNSSVAVGEGDCSSAVKLKNPVGFFPVPRSNISAGLMKLIKSLSHLFVYKEEGREEMEMEIGFPTDVKHVTHIGWDGSTTTTMNINGQDSFEPPELLSLPSISLGQFELAMAAQADATLADGPPPVRLT